MHASGSGHIAASIVRLLRNLHRLHDFLISLTSERLSMM